MDDDTKEPVINATITVINYGNGTVNAEDTTDSQGYYLIEGLSHGRYIITIVAEGYVNQTHEIVIETDSFGGSIPHELNVRLTPVPEVEGDGPSGKVSFPFIHLTGLVICIIFVVALLMYSKIKRENLLKNAVRKRIFDYIKENPGMHYRAILTSLDLPMGMLSYHINRLEKAQYIKSRQDGMFRRFYVKGKKTEMRFFLSDIQESILSVIRENQGISQSKIAEKVNVSRKVVNYHVNILDQAGLIFMESQGRETACYPIFPDLGE
jgi:DNA-binding MarR family transcriptional regulator